MPFFPENSTSQSQVCFFLWDLLSQIMGIDSFRNSVTSYLGPPMGNWVLSYFHKDTNDICVSHGSLLLWCFFKRTCWDGGNWADNLQLPHPPTSWNCHRKPPSPLAAICQWLSTAGPVELDPYSSTRDSPDRQSWLRMCPSTQLTLWQLHCSLKPHLPKFSSFRPLVTGVTLALWSTDFLSYSFGFLLPLFYNINELRNIW